MTFSLVARCAETGMFGVAISSSSPAVAARCSYARAGVGAVASQNITDPTLGPLALDLMQAGATAVQAIARIKAESAFIDYRQVLVISWPIPASRRLSSLGLNPHPAIWAIA
jgi:uncharacterized Ntn-hydrolase superfamily protein